MHRVLEGISRHKRIAAAYIFVGPPQSAKAQDAVDFALNLGCNQKIDLIKVQPDGTSLKIEQIREIQQMVRYGPSVGEFQFVIIERADELTAEAAGAFLKTLEEPPPKVVFILLVEREDRILPTINSRCQKIFFGEGDKVWQPDAELAVFYADLKNIKRKSIIELLEFSARLEKEKARIEALLYDLVFFARQELGDITVVRGLMEGIKNVKKRANLRLALDVMCLGLNAQ